MYLLVVLRIGDVDVCENVGGHVRLLVSGFPNRREKRLTEVLGLARAHAADAVQRFDASSAAARASSRSVVSWKMTYGRHAARAGNLAAAPARRRSNRSRSTSCHDSASIRDRFGDAVLDRPPLPRQRRGPGWLAASFSSADAALGQRQHRERIVGLPQQPVRDELLDVAAHLRHRRVAQQPERAQLVMAPRRSPARSSLPHSTLATCATPKRWPDPRDARQDLARDHDRLRGRLELVEAVVAGAAVGPRCSARRNRSTRWRWRQPTLAAYRSMSRSSLRARVGQLAVALEHQPPLHEVRARVDRARTPPRARRGRRGPTPADSARATAARRRGRRSGRRSDRCPCRTRRSRR